MAYIISVANSSAGNTSPQTVTFPTHAVGDLLLVFISQDGGGTSIATSSTGWATLGTQAASAGARSTWAYKVATSTTGEDPSFTGAADEWLFTAYVIGDVAAAPFGASPASGTDFVRSDFDFSSVKGRAASGSLTTATANCLVLYGWCLDGSNIANTYMRVSPGEVFTDAMINNSDAATTIAHTTGHVQMGAAGAAPTAYGYATRQDGGNCWVIAIRNATNGKLQRDCRAGCEPIKWFGNFGDTYETLTYNALSYVTTDTINSNAISTTAGTVIHTVADPSNVPGTATQVSTAENSTSWQGIGFDVPSTSYAGKVISFQWEVSSLTTGSGNGVDGWIVILSDGTNWRAYRFAYPAQVGLAAGLIYKTQVAVDAATEYASSGTLGSVTKVGFGHHRTGAGTRTFNIKNFMLIDQAKLIGGSATAPVQMSYWGDAMVAGGLTGVQQLQGSGQMLGKSKVQIGDGATPTYFDLSAQSFEFPFAYSAATLSRQWNADANSVGLNVKASSSDTINMTAGVLATSTAQPLTIDAASAVPSSYSFAGTSFVGWTITDSKGLHWQSATFKSGGTFTMAGGGDLTNCSFSKTTSSQAPLTITANGTTVATTTIDCVMDTGASSAYHIALGASVTALTLNGVTLSGTTSSTGSDNIYSELASGTLTITVDGTGTILVAGDVTFVGGSTAIAVIAAPQVYQQVVVSGFTAGSRVQIYDTTSSTELFNGTASAGATVVSGTTATWTDPNPATADRAIRVRISYVSGVTAKDFIETSGLTCGQTSGTKTVTYPVSPVDDTVYNANGENGATIYGGGEITFVDASPDRVEMNMTASTLSLQKQYAAWVYYAFTATGIATDIDYINAIDTANYEFTNIRWKNTATFPATLTITGGYAWDSSTGLAITLVDTAGGTIFLMPDHVVAYATGSGVTAQDKVDIAAEVLTQASSAPIYADARKMNGATINGTGVSGDLWRGA